MASSMTLKAATMEQTQTILPQRLHLRCGDGIINANSEGCDDRMMMTPMRA